MFSASYDGDVRSVMNQPELRPALARVDTDELQDDDSPEEFVRKSERTGHAGRTAGELTDV